MEQMSEGTIKHTCRSATETRMAQKKMLLYVAGSGLVVLCMAACGGSSAGNGGGSSPPSSAPTPGFTLSLSPSGVTIMQGGTNQVQVSVVGQSGWPHVAWATSKPVLDNCLLAQLSGRSFLRAKSRICNTGV